MSHILMMSKMFRRHLIIMFAKIAVLDFGSSYSQLIVKRIRALNVFAEIYDYQVSLDILKDSNIKGIILSGSPKTVFEEDAYLVSQKLFQLNKPILGVCYGVQLIAFLNQGLVTRMPEKEIGETTLKITQESLLTKDLSEEILVWMEHQDYLKELPLNYENLASTTKTSYAMIKHQNLPIYGVQFHPEVLVNQANLQIFKNFLFEICQITPDFTIDNFIARQVSEIKSIVKDDQVICGLSGGVDSSVVALLLQKALGDKLHCIFVDHGLMRKNEAAEVREVFLNQYQLNLKFIDAHDLFLNKLKGVSDPEKKRKIIGSTFIEVFSKEAQQISDAKWLAQGTIYSDVIESGVTTSKMVKSHHNVGGLPEELGFKLIEPLKMLFKDEVRQLGKALGLSDELINRQPFPGPGLAVRIIGDITLEKIRLVQESDAILHQVLTEEGLIDSIWQFFTVSPSISSVGVTGGERTYKHLIAIRAVNSGDGMKAEIAEIPYKVLNKIVDRIITNIPEINRVVYDITSKPPGTIEWE